VSTRTWNVYRHSQNGKKKTKKQKEKKKYGTNITIDKITHATARWLEKN
jgi:hypothetical protein